MLSISNEMPAWEVGVAGGVASSGKPSQMVNPGFGALGISEVVVGIFNVFIGYRTLKQNFFKQLAFCAHVLIFRHIKIPSIYPNTSIPIPNTQASPTTGMLKALCPACGSIINKVVRRADLEAIRAKRV